MAERGGWVTCDACRGDGVFPEGVCGRCGGRGRVYPRPHRDALTDLLAEIAGTHMATEQMHRLIDARDLILAWQQEEGWIQRTNWVWHPGRTGYAYGRNPQKDIPASVTLSDRAGPESRPMWLVNE